MVLTELVDPPVGLSAGLLRPGTIMQRNASVSVSDNAVNTRIATGKWLIDYSEDFYVYVCTVYIR